MSFAAAPLFVLAQEPVLDRAFLPAANGPSEGTAITTDDAGNVYTAGFFSATVDLDPGAGLSEVTSAGERDAYVTKVDASGHLVWARRLGGTGNEYPVAIAVDDSGSVYLTGRYDGLAEMDPGPASFELPYGGGSDIFITKLDREGDFAWAQGIGGAGYDAPNAMAFDGAGFLYIGGVFAGEAVDFAYGPGSLPLTAAGASGGSDGFLLKLDLDGGAWWAQRIGNAADDQVTDLAVDPSGDIVFTGTFVSDQADFDPAPNGWAVLTPIGLNDAFVAKWDSDANYIWALRMGGVGDDFGLGIATDAEGNIYTVGDLTGTFDADPDGEGSVLHAAGGTDVFVTKHAPGGTLLWARAIGGTSADNGMDIVVDAAGNSCIGGDHFGTIDLDPGDPVKTHVSAGDKDLFLMALDAQGEHQWHMGLGEVLNDLVYGLHRDVQGGIWATGSFYEAMDFDPGAGTFTLTADDSGSSAYALRLHVCSTVWGPVTTDTGCEAYVWNDEMFTESGTYQQHFSTVTACDSVATLLLTIANIDTTVENEGVKLVALQPGAMYQWVDCDHGSEAVDGATDAFFAPPQNGHYAVVITLDGCSATSSCHEVLSTGAAAPANEAEWNVSPNPAHDAMVVRAEEVLGEVTLWDAQGRSVRTWTVPDRTFRMDLSGTAPGLYLLRVMQGTRSCTRPVIVE